MAHRRTKSRTVFCRICDEDYVRLANLCEAEGGSISDFLRTALKERLNRDRETIDQLLTRVVALACSIDDLAKEIEQLRTLTVDSMRDSSRRVVSSIARVRAL